MKLLIDILWACAGVAGGVIASHMSYRFGYRAGNHDGREQGERQGFAAASAITVQIMMRDLYPLMARHGITAEEFQRALRLPPNVN